MSGGFNFKGFSMKPAGAKSSGAPQFSLNAVPPPSSLNQCSGRSQAKPSYSTIEAISSGTQYALGKRKAKLDDDDYFDDEDQEQTPEMAYIPGPDSPAAKKPESSDEDDPLDAFMMGIEQQVKRETKKAATASTTQSTSGTAAGKGSTKGVRGDIDDEDDEESYYRYMEENPMAGVVDEGSDQEMEYDEDGNPIPGPRKRDIDPLPPIDHSEIDYAPFEKNFYVAHEDISELSEVQVNELRRTLGVQVSGVQVPKPVTSFAHFSFDEALMKQIRKSEYTQPTSIQSQSIPAALSGRDLIGIAKTGSGKTAAFLWPMLVHIMDQKELQPGDGPIGLILAPTRELSLQIYAEAKKFGKVYNINVVCCYGGGSKYEQSKALEQGAEIVVATPGRMIDMVKMKATNLRRVTYLVLDEADRMFNMGFEPQVKNNA